MADPPTHKGDLKWTPPEPWVAALTTALIALFGLAYVAQEDGLASMGIWSGPKAILGK